MMSVKEGPCSSGESVHHDRITCLSADSAETFPMMLRVEL